jgi:hypothetical protein
MQNIVAINDYATRIRPCFKTKNKAKCNSWHDDKSTDSLAAHQHVEIIMRPGLNTFTDIDDSRDPMNIEGRKVVGSNQSIDVSKVPAVKAYLAAEGALVALMWLICLSCLVVGGVIFNTISKMDYLTKINGGNQWAYLNIGYLLVSTVVPFCIIRAAQMFIKATRLRYEDTFNIAGRGR